MAPDHDTTMAPVALDSATAAIRSATSWTCPRTMPHPSQQQILVFQPHLTVRSPAVAVTSALTMGTTLPQGLVTASRVSTPGSTDKALRTFLRSASTRKHSNDLADGNVYVGFYYFVGNKVCTLYIPKIVQPEVTAHPDGTAVTEGETWEGFLGQASNASA